MRPFAVQKMAAQLFETRQIVLCAQFHNLAVENFAQAQFGRRLKLIKGADLQGIGPQALAQGYLFQLHDILHSRVLADFGHALQTIGFHGLSFNGQRGSRIFNAVFATVRDRDGGHSLLEHYGQQELQLALREIR